MEYFFNQHYSISIAIKHITSLLIVRKNMLHMARQVEVEYRLFLMIDLSSYRSQPTFSGGCVKFYPLAFF